MEGAAMRRGIAIAAAVVVALLGLAAVNSVLTDTDDGPGWGRHSMAMAGWGSGSGWMGRPMMGSTRARDEAGYLSEMVAHHREAVVAAGELSRSQRPAMRAFGRDVVATQSAQIAQMEEWLAAWHPDEPEATYEPMMRDLSGLSGDALDRTFLEDMVWHHMAAVMSSQRLLVRGLAEHEEVARLARTIRDDQMDEIRWMRAMWSTMAP